jgi:hypothetical protein
MCENPSHAMQRTQYIFLDHENVCETDLSRITGKPAKVFMILGAGNKTLPVSLFLFAQDHPGQIRIVQTPVQGRNALDFVLTLELGRQLAADPDGYFHIVSKDTGFESVVRHLKDQKRLIARHTSLSGIPALWTPQERFEKLKGQLADNSTSRPSTRKTLENKIKSAFGNTGDPDIIEKAIADIVQSGILSFTEESKVNYKAA